MDLDLVIVSHNASKYLNQCLSSLILVDCNNITVIDNASTDDTHLVLEDFYNGQVIYNTENLGYSQACNQGAAFGKSKIIGFLNCDTAFIEVISPMIDYLEENDDIAAVGPKQIDSNGLIRFAGVVFEKCAMRTLVGSYHRGWGENDIGKYDDIIDSHYISGSAFFIKRKIFDEVGGWESRLPLYFEDNLMCLRLQKRKYRTVYYGKTKMIHEWMKSNNPGERNKRLWTSISEFRKICASEGLDDRLDYFKNHE